MIAAEDCVLVLLAAGRSTRFGGGSKLEQDLVGMPVGLHVAAALEGMPFLERVAVVDGTRLDYAAHGFTVVRNPDAARGMATSVRCGAGHARTRGAKAMVIVLADMPRVTAAHVRRLLDAADGAEAVVMSSDGSQPMPPGVFGAARFEALLTLDGDQGARGMVKAGRRVVTAPAELVDVDTPADLDRLRASARP